MQNVHALENALINRNNIAGNIDGQFGEVQPGKQAAMCSDCCSSNGNSCDPRDDTYEPQN